MKGRPKKPHLISVAQCEETLDSSDGQLAIQVSSGGQLMILGSSSGQCVGVLGNWRFYVGAVGGGKECLDPGNINGLFKWQCVTSSRLQKRGSIRHMSSTTMYSELYTKLNNTYSYRLGLSGKLESREHFGASWFMWMGWLLRAQRSTLERIRTIS
jgi:hypothetical protein